MPLEMCSFLTHTFAELWDCSDILRNGLTLTWPSKNSPAWGRCVRSSDQGPPGETKIGVEFFGGEEGVCSLQSRGMTPTEAVAAHNS
jgi:hypothetical protein